MKEGIAATQSVTVPAPSSAPTECFGGTWKLVDVQIFPDRPEKERVWHTWALAPNKESALPTIKRQIEEQIKAMQTAVRLYAAPVMAQEGYHGLASHNGNNYFWDGGKWRITTAPEFAEMLEIKATREVLLREARR
jgi:hypothetical protein